MQLKDDGNENAGTKQGQNGARTMGPPPGLEQLALGDLNSNKNTVERRDVLNETGLSSTFKSIEFPPKEYEQQLQQYEADVRNHIKVEQQLKLHIEVLNEKIEDVDKEKEQLRQ